MSEIVETDAEFIPVFAAQSNVHAFVQDFRNRKLRMRYAPPTTDIIRGSALLVGDAVSFQGGRVGFTALLLTDNDWVSMRDVASNSDGDSALETNQGFP